MSRLQCYSGIDNQIIQSNATVYSPSIDVKLLYYCHAFQCENLSIQRKSISKNNISVLVAELTDSSNETSARDLIIILLTPSI